VVVIVMAHQVNTRTIGWLELVLSVEKEHFYDSPVVYEFAGGRRKFLDSGPSGGVYAAIPSDARGTIEGDVRVTEDGEIRTIIP
jgi:hypothetical protein